MIIPKRKWRYPISIEREYAKLLVAIVRKKFELVKNFIPEMADELLKNQIKQDGLGDWIEKLVGKVKNKLEKVSAVPIVAKIFGKIDKHVKTEQSETMKSVFGVEPKVEPRPRDFEMLKTIWTAENMTLIKSIDTQTLEKIQFSLSQKIISTADKKILMSELTKEIQEIAGVSEKRAALIGADQVNKLNGKLVQYRQTSAGIESYIWRTMGDKRVRPAHRARAGVVYKWSNPPEGGHPGQAVRCRCVAQPLIDESSFKLVPQKNSYTEQNQNDIIKSRLQYVFEKNINTQNTQPKFIAKVDVKNTDDVIKFVESYIVNAKIENAVIVTKSGEIYHCTGDLNSLESIEKLGNKLNGATVTHNHPKNSANDWTFSDDDVTLFRNFELAKLRGVDEKFFYEFTRNAKEIDDTVLFGEVNEFNAWHGQIVETAKFYKIGYRRWEQ